MLIALSLRRATMAIVLLVTFGIFLTSCNKEELDQELAPLASDDAPKTLADYPEAITIDNWREFVTAPKEVLDHFDKLDRVQQQSNRTTQSIDLEAASQNRSSTLMVGLVQAYNGAWVPMPGVDISGSSFPSTDAFPNNYLSIFDPMNPELCMSYNTSTLNGVTTFDLVVIQRHLLQLECFSEFREYIAADADRDGQITSYDIDLIQDMILVRITEWPESQNVVFVPDSDYTSGDSAISGCTGPSAAFIEATGETEACLDIFDPQDEYFRLRRAIKTGDLNGSFSF